MPRHYVDYARARGKFTFAVVRLLARMKHENMESSAGQAPYADPKMLPSVRIGTRRSHGACL